LPDPIAFVLDLNILVITLGLVTVGSVYLGLRTRTPQYMRSRITDQKEVIGDLRSRLNSYRGKYQKLSQGVSLQKGTKAPESLEEATQMIPNVIDAFIPHLPKKYQIIATNPKVRDFLSGIAGKVMKDYPKEATEFIGGFVPPVITAVADRIGSESNTIKEL